MLRALPHATADPAGGPHRLLLEGTKVEVIEVGQLPPVEELDNLSDRQRLFIAAHSWALQTATPLTVASVGPDADQATAPFATVAALVAMVAHQRRGADDHRRERDPGARDAAARRPALTHPTSIHVHRTRLERPPEPVTQRRLSLPVWLPAVTL